MKEHREYKNGFIILNFSEEIRLLVFMMKKKDECLEFYQKEGLNGLSFENSIYYSLEDLSILQNYSFINYLEIGILNLKDLSGIQYIPQLKGLYVASNVAFLDFNWIKNTLEMLTIDWHKKMLNIEQLSFLRYLNIWGDTDEVLYPPNLVELRICKSKRINLNFLKDCNKIKKMDLYGNRKLSDIEGLAYLSDSLEELEIDACKNITDFSPILALNKLKKLEIISYSKDKKEELKTLKQKLNPDTIFYI